MKSLVGMVGRRPFLLSTLALLEAPMPHVLRAAAPPFDLAVPPDMVVLPARDASLFVAGNFRTGTTISVQRIAVSELLKLRPTSAACESGGLLSCKEGAAAVASVLAAFRDRQTAPSGSSSAVIPESVRWDDGKLSFEMLLTLVGDNASEALRADPELSRRTAVAALDDGGDLLCLWAGATASNWDAGDGAILQRAQASFAHTLKL